MIRRLVTLTGIKKTPPDTDGGKWRRRESNPEAHSLKHCAGNDLQELPSELGVNREWNGDVNGHELAPDGNDSNLSLVMIILAWPKLPIHLRQAILTIAKGSVDL